MINHGPLHGKRSPWAGVSLILSLTTAWWSLGIHRFEVEAQDFQADTFSFSKNQCQETCKQSCLLLYGLLRMKPSQHLFCWKVTSNARCPVLSHLILAHLKELLELPSRFVSNRGSKIESSLSSANISVLYFYRSGTASSWNRKPQRLDAAIEAENDRVETVARHGHFWGCWRWSRSVTTAAFIILVLQERFQNPLYTYLAVFLLLLWTVTAFLGHNVLE